jgi:hypothetical protein
MLPAPPRPVEKAWVPEASVGRTGRGSLPRGLEKSSGPVSGLASREAEAWRMFPAPPRPDEYCEMSEIKERVKQGRGNTHETVATSGEGSVTFRRRRRSL